MAAEHRSEEDFRMFVVSALLFLFFSIEAAGQNVRYELSSPFPLGQVPNGWTYAALGEFERRIQDLPFEVKGVLERSFGERRKIEIFVMMIPVQKNAARRPASLWQTVDRIFAPEGITPAKTYELGIQDDVGPGRRWSFRESKISRAGVSMNIGAFQSKQKYHDIYIVLRGSDADYRRELPQLKDLMREIKIDSI